VTFSTAMEGVNTNVILAGMASGMVLVWSALDLTPVRRLTESTSPVTCIAIKCASEALWGGPACESASELTRRDASELLFRCVAVVRYSPDNTALWVAYGDGEVIGFTSTKEKERERSQRRLALT